MATVYISVRMPCDRCGQTRCIVVRPSRAKYRALCRACMKLLAVPKGSLEERFWRRVDKNGPIPAHCPEIGRCWTCKARSKRKNYPRLGAGRRGEGIVLGHRLSFFFAYGHWPEPFCCHHCDNPDCVNPAHLFEGDAKANGQDMVAKGRDYNGSDRITHCPAGHPYGDGNVRLNKHGARVCRACISERNSEAWEGMKGREPITAFGRTLPLFTWAKEVGLHGMTLAYRIRVSGMPPELAMLIPGGRHGASEERRRELARWSRAYEEARA